MGYKSSMAIEGKNEFAAAAAGTKKSRPPKEAARESQFVPAVDRYMPVFCPAGCGL
jgi:hypothetical protein